MTLPRPYTPTEFRSTVLDSILGNARYWETVIPRPIPGLDPNPEPLTPLRRVQGFGFSFLCILDGVSGDCPGVNLVKYDDAIANDKADRLLEKFAMPWPLFLAPEHDWLRPFFDLNYKTFGIQTATPTLNTGEDFAKIVWDICTHCGSEDSLSVHERMCCAAIQLLALLDRFYLYPGVHESDEDYNKGNGDNWWARPYGEEEALLDQVTFSSGMLHEVYHGSFSH